MVEPTPALFDRIPRSLFGPLGNPYAELYWELLATLYKCEFERELFVVLRPVVLDIAEQAVRNSTLWSTRRAELEAFAREEETSDATVQDENSVVRDLTAVTMSSRSVGGRASA